MSTERTRARDLVGQFERTARHQSAETAPPPPADRNQAGVGAAESDLLGGPRYARLYISWETADQLDAQHRALRRRSRGRISKLQLADALITVALAHPDEVNAELKRRGFQQPGGDGTSPVR